MTRSKTNMPFDLGGRVVLVTGASSGLGERFARIAAASGARVVAGARRIERLQQLHEEARGEGQDILPVALDVTDEASVIAAFDAAEAAFGPVDTVIANAGINIAGSALGMSIEDFDSMSHVNFRGVFLTAREGARRMIAAGSAGRGTGRILLISSITAHQVADRAPIYCATKAAVAQLGRALARDWAMKGINVNVLCPGYIETEMNEHAWELDGGKALLASFPRRRIMEASALDAMVLYLCSDASQQTTGSVLTIDDGQTL
ncbi:SDR family NAD(P)-dependent oxidoreductase [Erythrobacter sp.]|uniref:SDR family NAD(P)-dependent oxidoreductase n=1 Tax=Erythrobacter sp. TaxID=1042 RepID=UPI0034493817